MNKLMLICLIIICVVFNFSCSSKEEKQRQEAIQAQSEDFVIVKSLCLPQKINMGDGNGIRAYILQDKHTGVKYLYFWTYF